MINTTQPSPSETSSPHMLFKASWQDGTRSSTPTPKASPKPLGPTPTPCSRLEIITADRPRFWWLRPWTYARTWHTVLVALKDYADRADGALDLQGKVIKDQSREIQTLRAQLADLHRLTTEREELLDTGDYVAEQYFHMWKDKFGPGTTPESIQRWNYIKTRHAR